MAGANQSHCTGVGVPLDIAQGRIQRRAVEEEMTMAWTTPSLVEICIGLEINGYLPAEF
jgi:coenzyme PQQ precursor peptide PqqA